jgi:hypothetical protein
MDNNICYKCALLTLICIAVLTVIQNYYAKSEMFYVNFTEKQYAMHNKKDYYYHHKK